METLVRRFYAETEFALLHYTVVVPTAVTMEIVLIIMMDNCAITAGFTLFVTQATRKKKTVTLHVFLRNN